MRNLTFTDREFVSLRDRSFRWFDLKKFTYSPDTKLDAMSIIQSLILDWRYRDHYASGDSHEHDTGKLHGPFWVEKISTLDFTEISSYEFEEEIHDFCHLFNIPPTVDKQREINSIILPLSTHRTRHFRLTKPLDLDIHEWGYVLQEFRELVAIDSSTGCLGLLVMGID